MNGKGPSLLGRISSQDLRGSQCTAKILWGTYSTIRHADVSRGGAQPFGTTGNTRACSIHRMGSTYCACAKKWQKEHIHLWWFKLTVNQVSRPDRYPIPKIVDLLAKLSGGKMFMKLDMRQAYHQLLLDEESKQYVVVNTPKGLFKYNHLPFGVSLALGIFQWVMESIL